jgi:hypothetical protein
MLGQNLRDRRRQRRLPVIDMPNGSYVYVRLTTVKFFLCHDSPPQNANQDRRDSNRANLLR